MILISHRGNLNGRESEENNPYKLDMLLDLGYNIEIDVWFNDNKFFLGHDSPEYRVSLDYLQNDLLWCHAKNLLSLEIMLKEGIHCFWHQTDDFTLTSRGFIWTYPNKPVLKKNIIVCQTLEDTTYYSKRDVAGICSDYIGYLK
jgi:hypothetical protein